MDNNKIKISVVIPSFENVDAFISSFNSVLNQRYKPKEIIVVDSSKTNNIKNYLKDKNNYSSNLKIVYHNEKNLFPGKARNIGASISKYDWIAFLDSKTVANEEWLFDYKEKILKNNYDVIFGSTKFITKDKYKISKIFLYATYGNKPHCTVPGSIIKREFFFQNKFLEKYRSGEDVFWREKIIDNFLIKTLIINDRYYLTYDQISNKLINNLLKHFTYSIHSSTISIKNNIKDIYLSLFLILTALIVPKWNILIGGWDANPLYIPNITKLYILTLSLILIIYIIFKNALLSFKIFRENFFIKIIIFILFIFLTIFIFRWNEVYSLKYYSTIFKIPHITKYYIFSILLLTIIYRGLYVPIINKIQIKELKYLYWIKVGIIGLLIDIVKAPAFLFGSIVSLFRLEFLFNLNESINLKKNLLIICPFPYDVQAGQRLKYEQHLKYFYLNGYNIKLSPFINYNTWNIIYKKGHNIKKIFALFRGYIIRTLRLITLRRYDVVYVFMWVTPYTSNIYEKIYRKLSKKIIYDMEDNILIISNNEINPITSSFKSINKYKYLIESSDQSIVSSQHLKDFCNNLTNRNNSNYICASINMERYIRKIHKTNDVINIGWTGTFSTKKYLKVIEPTIIKLSKIKKINFIVIGDFDYDLENVNVKNIKWKKSTEIDDLLKIDIGIYPLFKDDWVLGKSGLKALQYMALGIPAVATNFGNIQKIIINNYNGFLVDDDQWFDILIKLCDNIDLRNYIGNNGRNHVKQNYSVEVLSEKYLEVFNRL